MWIDLERFTPLESTIGGLLIGLAALILILFCGRIMGISGIVGGLFKKSGDYAWRIAFLIGLFAAPWLYQIVAEKPSVTLDASWLVVVIAGLLVGVGTRIGSGCTSGHGVCGLSRFSLRSLITTIVFMVVAIMTVFIVGLFN